MNASDCPRAARLSGGELAGVSGPLADDLSCGLVLPQALEPRVPQPSVPGPLAEADLCDQLGPDPVDVGFADLVGEGTAALVKPVESMARSVNRVSPNPVPTLPAWRSRSAS